MLKDVLLLCSYFTSCTLKLCTPILLDGSNDKEYRVFNWSLFVIPLIAGNKLESLYNIKPQKLHNKHFIMEQIEAKELSKHQSPSTFSVPNINTFFKYSTKLPLQHKATTSAQSYHFSIMHFHFPI